jgi:AraC family transcriptional regulator, regulatory protein of adaptative response / methylated-DNA-[protein]-cysteine methyltransferase
LTTGVYCRPSCAARTPRPENVRFHATREAAEQQGYRPCKRCKPEQPSRAERDAQLVAQLCGYLEQSETPPTLEQLAARAGLSVYHMHRLFKSVTGVTPKRYAAERRAERVRSELSEPGKVTDAIYSAGFVSSGRFYEQAPRTLGMTPSQYRDGGAELTIRFAVGQCSLGALLVAATSRGVCAILLGDEPDALVHDLERRFGRAELVGADAQFEQLVARVVALVEAPGTGEQLPLELRGTIFQQRVWEALTKIPPGRTLSYRELAEAVGAPRAVRAVASACAANALAIAIPCHRVVRTDGSLSGYRWGIERKRELLAREAKHARS